MSARIYRLNRQPAFINEEVKDLLRKPCGQTPNEYGKLEQQNEEVQPKLRTFSLRTVPYISTCFCRSKYPGLPKEQRLQS